MLIIINESLSCSTFAHYQGFPCSIRNTLMTWRQTNSDTSRCISRLRPFYNTSYVHVYNHKDNDRTQNRRLIEIFMWLLEYSQKPCVLTRFHIFCTNFTILSILHLSHCIKVTECIKKPDKRSKYSHWNQSSKKVNEGAIGQAS